MGTLGDQLRAIRQRAIAAGMRLLSEDEIGEQLPPPQILWCPQEAGTGCRLPAVPCQSASAIPRNLKRLREARGLTVAELARRTKAEPYGPVSASTIRAMERTEGAGPNPCLTTLLALSLALEVGIEELVEEQD